MPMSVACACGRVIRVKESMAGKRIRCPDCDGPVQVPDENEIEVEVVDEDDEPERPRRSRTEKSRGRASSRFSRDEDEEGDPRPRRRIALKRRRSPGNDTWRPIASLGCFIPAAVLIFCFWLGDLIFEKKGEVLPTLIISAIALSISAGLGWLTYSVMAGRWTPGKIVGALGISGLLLVLGLLAAKQSATKRDVTDRFVAVVEEFPDAAETFPKGNTGFKGGVFPLLLNAKKEKDTRVKGKPTIAYALLDDLPSSLKPKNADEVHSLVLVAYEWKPGIPYVKDASVAAKAFLGACRVTVVDRKTRTIVAETVLDSPEKQPEKILEKAGDWYGEQPDDKQIINWLKQLPVVK